MTASELARYWFTVFRVRRDVTHWEGCERTHIACALRIINDTLNANQAEIAELRERLDAYEVAGA